MEMKEIRQRLVEQRKRLESDRDRAEVSDSGLGTSDPGELSTVDQHPADQGTENFERERVQAIIDQIETRIEEVDAALHRLDSGEYGRCQVCGKEIPEERIAARPEARYCVEHQRQVERDVRS